MNYKGVIIEESLEDRAILARVRVLESKVAQVTPRHKTPWLKQWTLDTVEVEEDDMASVAEAVSASLDRSHGGSWYADFLNERNHYVVFRGRVFLINRRNKAGYDEAVRYGAALGIPPYQLDFSNDLIG